MDEHYAGKTAIVTGGASGIGRALGAELARFGAHVVLADIDRAAAARAAVEIDDRRGGGSVTAVGLDVRDGGAWETRVDDVCAQHGRIDFLFNNAGISTGGPTHHMPAQYWDRIIDVNIRGVVNGVLAVYPRMVAQRSGHIVNTASLAGLAPTVLVAAYSMTKHAVVGLSTSLRPEAAAHGVRVNVLCPGAVETPILDQAAPADLPDRTGVVLTPRQYFDRAGLPFAPVAADKFARRALRGVAANQAVIVVPANGKAVWWLARLSPRVMDVIGRRTARRVLGGDGA